MNNNNGRKKRRRTRSPNAAMNAATRAFSAAVDAARRRMAASARGYATAALGAAAAFGHKRRPRGMGGSGLPFARHEGLEGRPFAKNFAGDEPFALRKAVRVGPHAFSKNNLRQMLAVNPQAVNPLTRRPLPARVHGRYGPEAYRLMQTIIAYFRDRQRSLAKVANGVVRRILNESTETLDDLNIIVRAHTFNLRIVSGWQEDNDYDIRILAYAGTDDARLKRGDEPDIDLVYYLDFDDHVHVHHDERHSRPEWVSTALVAIFQDALQREFDARRNT